MKYIYVYKTPYQMPNEMTNLHPVKKSDEKFIFLRYKQELFSNF